MPIRLESLTRLHSVLEAFWQQIGIYTNPLPDSMLYHALTTAAIEIASNIVRHAYPPNAPNGELEMRLLLLADAIEIHFQDRGVEFREEPTLPMLDPTAVERLSEGGLGLWLARRSVDELRYARQGDVNVWKLYKRLQP